MYPSDRWSPTALVVANCRLVVRYAILLCSALLPVSSLATVVATLGVEGVTDNVRYSPNMENGGFADPQTRPRFLAYSLGVDWQVTARTSFSLTVAHRELNSLRDSFDIGQLALNAFTVLSPRTAPYTLGLAVGVSVNHADSLIKNSYTHYNGAIIREASINQPQDRRLMMGLVAGLPLGHGFALTARLGAGLIHNSHDSMQGQGQSVEDCQYAFMTTSQTGSLTQQGSCGALISYSQQFANEDGVEERLGFRSSQDVSYRARFIEAGADMAWGHKAISLTLGYRIRRYYRDHLDQRIEANGDTPTRFSHVSRATVSYRLNRRWSLSLASIYQTAPYLDDVPMLYTAFTSQRFSGANALSFQVRSTFTF